MGIPFGRNIKLWCAILLIGFVGSAVAYQHDKTFRSSSAEATSSPPAFSINEKQAEIADRPSRCYLALHLEMAGAPFAVSAADVKAGMAHLCAGEISPQEPQVEAKDD